MREYLYEKNLLLIGKYRKRERERKNRVESTSFYVFLFSTKNDFIENIRMNKYFKERGRKKGIFVGEEMYLNIKF